MTTTLSSPVTAASQAGVNRSLDRNGGRGHGRVPYPRRFRAKVDDQEHFGHVQDISGGGAALLAETHLDNSAFVQLHIEGMKSMDGRVVRTFERGYAVEFVMDAEARYRLSSQLLAQAAAQPYEDSHKSVA